MTKPNIKVEDKGIFMIKGGATLVYHDGSKVIKEGTVALSRWGLSVNKPFCDVSHKECTTWW